MPNPGTYAIAPQAWIAKLPDLTKKWFQNAKSRDLRDRAPGLDNETRPILSSQWPQNVKSRDLHDRAPGLARETPPI